MNQIDESFEELMRLINEHERLLTYLPRGDIGKAIASNEFKIIKLYYNLKGYQYETPKDGFERTKMVEDIIKEVVPQNTRK